MSEIKGFYAGRNVFVTGATGFLGAILLEKLVRSCPDINSVYILIREKNGTIVRDRLKKLLALPVFKSLDEKSKSKIIPLQGDLGTDNLGLNSEDLKTLVNNISVVFHVAANINFSSRLTRSLEINVVGTRRVLQLAKSMPQIKSLVYVSTAYANSILGEVIEEKVYPIEYTPDELLKPSYFDKLNEPEVQTQILGDHPNTYSFTKLMAENVVKDERGDVPVAIVRPSIVLGTLKEPMPGWVDNVYNGQFAFIAGASAGVFRSLYVDPHKVTDMVPSDQLASLVVASAFIAHKERSFKVYHFTSGSKNPITWDQFAKLTMQGIYKYPLRKEAAYPIAKCRPSRWRNTIQFYISHYIQAIILDMFAPFTKQKPNQRDIQRKYYKGMEHGKYFTMNQFDFSTYNTDQLNQSLSERDKTDFDFDIGQINWKNYLENCVLGVRKYYFKEDISNLSQARLFHNMDKALYFVFWLALIWIFWLTLSPIGSISLPLAIFIVFLYYIL